MLNILVILEDNLDVHVLGDTGCFFRCYKAYICLDNSWRIHLGNKIQKKNQIILLTKNYGKKSGFSGKQIWINSTCSVAVNFALIVAFWLWILQKRSTIVLKRSKSEANNQFIQKKKKRRLMIQIFTHYDLYKCMYMPCFPVLVSERTGEAYLLSTKHHFMNNGIRRLLNHKAK